MSKILKNNTGSDIVIGDTGVTVTTSTNLTIPPFEYNLYAESDDIIPLIGNNSIIVNDGSKDLSPSQGINLIQGNFPTAAGGVGGYNLYDPVHVVVDCSNTQITLPRSNEAYNSLYNYSGSGALSGFAARFNSANVLVRLEIDTSQIFEMDCSILEDMSPGGNPNSPIGKFLWISWDSSKSVLTFSPKHDLAFSTNLKIQAKANSTSNQRSSLNYLVDIIKES